MTPTLVSLPSKLLQAIADHIPSEPEVRCLAQSHPQLDSILTPYIRARKDRKERSNLLISAIQNSKPPQLCQLLLRDGADPEMRVRTEQGKTALHFAAETGQTVVARLLLLHKRSLLNIRDGIGRTPLMSAAEGGHGAVVRTLLSAQYGPADVTLRSCRNRSVLWYAANGGNVKIVQMLLDTGYLDHNAADNDGVTPFACATSEGHSLRGHAEVVKLLLATGRVQFDARDHQGMTPLMWAAKFQRTPVVELLLSTGQLQVDFDLSELRKGPRLFGPPKLDQSLVKLLDAYKKRDA
ncbi:ankyrin repeat domain-containing protein [Aspergillus novofumigatus IBT 16806]|uniref:Ankyrin n=1 Tax=Aspergillus novofumigatus (strain IBT 16806) TaxID=1392255 RepID=A0A2I1CJK1_ASPN1|nr:ankyrin [Aspergillus novofumigatus IBT 16806]PKX97808.1 ankyrin [Aspergillus novofumigatus IBT 16806]